MGLTSSKLSAKEMAPLCRELATTYGAGVPLLRTLEFASQHSSSSAVRHMLERMGAAIRNGATLAEAVRAEESLLPDMFMEVIAAGEIGGRLDELFDELANYYESIAQMWRSAVAAMIYPMLQLISAWFLGTFALGIVRRFDVNATTPFSVSRYFREYAMFQAQALITAAIIVAILIVLARLGVLQLPWALLKNVIWPVRHIANKFAMARFFRTFALLLSSGLDLRRCIERSAAVTMNPLIERDLLRAVPVVMSGGTLVQAFSGSRYISRVGQEMIAVGEQSGRLDATLRKVAEYHYNEAQAAVNAATKLLFVATVLVVGVIIGAIVIYFYANLYGSLMSNF